MARILVIEDDESIRNLFRIVLEREGYQVDVAADGALGLRSHQERPADLIITDMFMPEKEGLETIMELRRGGTPVPIIAVSGGGSQRNLDYLGIAKTLGAVKTMAKPISRQDLIDAVKEALG